MWYVKEHKCSIFQDDVAAVGGDVADPLGQVRGSVTRAVGDPHGAGFEDITDAVAKANFGALGEIGFLDVRF